MSSTLTGKVALVTGAAQGAGRGVADALADEGASVAAVGRPLEKLEVVADEIEARGGRARAMRCDVGVDDDIVGVVGSVVAEFGTVDILVNAAQHTTRGGWLLQVDERDVELLWRTGPLATLRFMRACHPFLRDGGSIVNFGSGAQYAPEGYGVYAATKDAIQAITRAAAVEWGRDGIRVNIVHPNAVFDTGIWTEEVLRSRAESYGLSVEEYRRNNVLQVAVTSRDVAEMVAEMCGPVFSRTTAAQVPVDGGNERVI